jgi:hypothetical protein
MWLFQNTEISFRMQYMMQLRWCNVGDNESGSTFKMPLLEAFSLYQISLLSTASFTFDIVCLLRKQVVKQVHILMHLSFCQTGILKPKGFSELEQNVKNLYL